MKNIYNYRLYLGIALVSLLGGCVLNLLQLDIISSETFALTSFFFFTTAVLIVAWEELPSLKKSKVKKIYPLFSIWKKLKK